MQDTERTLTASDDGKDPAALRTIGEVAALTGLKTHVLRYWEQQFDTLRPLQRSGGRRYYRPADVALVREIDRLVNREGYTLKGARAALKGWAAAAANPAPEPERADSSVPADIVPQLKAIREDLRAALAA